MKNPWIIDGQMPETGFQPSEVATNADKLALTGLNAGDIAIITGEGNRVEMYNGGTISSDSGWDIVRNTYQLQFAVPGSPLSAPLVNGVTCLHGQLTVVGWFGVEEVIPCLITDWYWSELYIEHTENVICQHTDYRGFDTTLRDEFTDDNSNLWMPRTLPPRAVVRFTLIY